MGSGASKKDKPNNNSKERWEPLSPYKIDLSKLTKQKTRQFAKNNLLDEISPVQQKSKYDEFNDDEKVSQKEEISKQSEEIQKNQFHLYSQQQSLHAKENKRDDQDAVSSPVRNEKSKQNTFFQSLSINSINRSNTLLQNKHEIAKFKFKGNSKNIEDSKKVKLIQNSAENLFQLKKQFKTVSNNQQNQQNQNKNKISLALQHEFQTSKQIEAPNKNHNNTLKRNTYFNNQGISGSYYDNNGEEFGDEEGESQYLSLNSSEEEKRRDNIRKKNKVKKHMKENKKITSQNYTYQKVLKKGSLDQESQYSEDGDKNRKNYQKDKFFIESLSQMVMDRRTDTQKQIDGKNIDSFEKKLQEDNQFGDCSSVDFNNDSLYDTIQEGETGRRGVFGSKKRRLFSSADDQKDGINKDDVEANDSFESQLENIDELNMTGDITSRPRQKDKEDFIRIAPFTSPKQNNFTAQMTKFHSGVIDSQSYHPSSINYNTSSLNEINNSNKLKNMKKIYARSTHSLVAEKPGAEKQIKIDVIEMTEDGHNVKVRLENKEILAENGICVNSKKGNNPDHVYNMSDYFVYIDKNIKLISVFQGHGAYGNFVSNLACRLVFKHFFREPLIKLQPQIGFKRLFMNVDKFINQHIIYYELNLLIEKIIKSSTIILKGDNLNLKIFMIYCFKFIKEIPNNFIKKEDTYNCMLSGTCCSLVLVEKNKIFVASLGNTQAVIFKQQATYKPSKTNFVQLSGSHLPTNPIEKERIHKNTGEIRQWKSDFIDRVFVRGRTFPGIEVTRCLGNEVAKMIGVINEPDIYYYEVTKQCDQFLLVTTPNFFELISIDEVYSILNPYNQKTVKKASEQLLKRIKSLQQQETEILNDITFVLYYFF